MALAKRPEEMSDEELDAELARHQAPSAGLSLAKKPEDMSDQELDAALAQHQTKKPEKKQIGLYGGGAASVPEGATDAALEGAGNALSFGYLPHLQAAVEKPLYGALNAVTGQDVQPDDYVTARDRNIERMNSEEREHPIASKAGGLAGGLVGSMATPIPGMGAGGGILKTAAQGAGYGAAQGALQNPGDIKGKIDPLQLEEREQGAIQGAKMGGAAGAATGLVSKGLGALSRSGEVAEKVGNENAIKASGGMLRDFRTMGAKGQIEPVGSFAMENGLVKAGDTTEDIAVKADAFNKKAGEELDKVYSEAREKFGKQADKIGFDPKRDKAAILESARQELGDTVGAKTAISKLENYLDEVSSRHGDQPNEAAKSAFGEAFEGYKGKFKEYLKNRKSYKNAVGTAGENAEQPVLPGLTDDLQRTGSQKVNPELIGKDAEVMSSQESFPSKQMHLLERELPEHSKEGFNAMSREDLRPLQEKMVLDEATSNDTLNRSKQGKIEGTGLVDRSYGEAEVPGVKSGYGQTEMPFEPNKPTRPERPNEIRNPKSPKAANDIKTAIDKEINYARNPLNGEPPATEKAFSAARKAISKKVEESIESLGGSELVDRLKKANRDYGYSKQLSSMAEDKIARENSNRAISLTDTIAGGAGAAVGGGVGALSGGDSKHASEGAIIGGLLSGAANKGLRKYGPSTLAAGARAASVPLGLLARPASLGASATNNPALLRSIIENQTLGKKDKK